MELEFNLRLRISDLRCRNCPIFSLNLPPGGFLLLVIEVLEVLYEVVIYGERRQFDAV